MSASAQNIPLQRPRIETLEILPRSTIERNDMLYYAVIFLVVALIAALFGFTGIAASAVGIAKILFFVFVLLFAVSLIFGLMRRG